MNLLKIGSIALAVSILLSIGWILIVVVELEIGVFSIFWLIILTSLVHLLAITGIYGYIITTFTLDIPFVQTIRQVAIIFGAITAIKVVAGILPLPTPIFNVVGYTSMALMFIPLALLLRSDPPRRQDRKLYLLLVAIIGIIAVLPLVSLLLVPVFFITGFENFELLRTISSLIGLIAELLYIPLIYVLSRYSFLDEEPDQQEMLYMNPDTA